MSIIGFSLSLKFLSGGCLKGSRMVGMLDTIGFLSVPLPPEHRCLVPLADDPDSIIIPEMKTAGDEVVRHLSYVQKDETPMGDTDGNSLSLFGGHHNWRQREANFKLNATMKMHCGFMKGGGGEMEDVDIKYASKCRFVVASGIFDGYDSPHEPANISVRSMKLFCFLMVVDEKSLELMKMNESYVEDSKGGRWIGTWRLVPFHKPPYDEPRRNGKVPKILTHRLFPQAQFSIWIDGKMKLIADPLLLLERYLWRGKYTFAIASHKYHRSIYEEADGIKRRKRYARPLIDQHMKIYKYEGMKVWSPTQKKMSDVPEGAIIIREHTTMNNLFSCLWFNEVDFLTPRDQLSFGYVVHRLGSAFKFFMFPNCEFNSLFVLNRHTREHSSRVEWAKTMDEIKQRQTEMKESRGGLGLWSPYPGNLDSVELPVVKRRSSFH